MLIRWVIAFAAGIALAWPAAASDETKSRAAKSVALHIALAGTCQRVLNDPSVFGAAREDAVVTLQAGGYSADEAQAMLTGFASKLDPDGVAGATPAFCQGMLKNITDGRESFRAELQSAR